MGLCKNSCPLHSDLLMTCRESSALTRNHFHRLVDNDFSAVGGSNYTRLSIRYTCNCRPV